MILADFSGKTPKVSITRPAPATPAGRPLPALTGWYESTLAPRLAVLAHESGLYPPVYVRSVGWQRPRPFVVLADGTEKRFGTIAQACKFAMQEAN